jgi:DNA repair exonuclease SbcCD ATPase subunit
MAMATRNPVAGSGYSYLCYDLCSYFDPAKERHMRCQAFIALLLTMGAVCLQAESLAEIAARNKESRKAGDQKVYTEKDLRDARGDKASLSIAQTRDATSADESSNNERSTGSRSFSSEAASNGVSDLDRLKAKIKTWRQRYAPVALEVEKLENEIKELEEEVSRTTTPVELAPFGEPRDNSPLILKAQRARERLPGARRELERARRRLAMIEENARKDGVSPSQLSR